eukprot:gene8322-11263_t
MKPLSSFIQPQRPHSSPGGYRSPQSANLNNSSPFSPESHHEQPFFGNSSGRYLNSPAKSDASGAGSAMLDVKLDRKRVESDLQLLSNRIALLKVEEQRALHKVVETKQRADEILEIKKRNEDFLQSRMTHKAMVEISKRLAQEKAAQEREERRSRIASNKKAIIDEKRFVAVQTKQQSRQVEELVMHSKIQVELEKRAKAEELRKKRELLRIQKEEAKIKQEQKNQIYYINKMEAEAKKKREAEMMIEAMENEERELIRRLKTTQELQQKAYEELQKSLQT